MGAKQSGHTKKTFIHIDRKERDSVDDSFTIDNRLTKSCPANAPLSPQNSVMEEENRNAARTPDDQTVIDNREAGSRPRGLSLVDALAKGKDELVAGDSPKANRKLVSLSECLGADKHREGRMTDPTGLAAMRHAALTIPSPLSASPHGPMLMVQMPVVMPMHPGWNNASPPVTPTLRAEQAKVAPLAAETKVTESTDRTSPSKKKQLRVVEKGEKDKRDAPRESIPVAENKSTWTTRMLRNLPNDYTRQDLLDFLDAQKVLYDFVYLPIDWGKRANLGYAFVNLVSPEEAERIGDLLTGFTDWKVASDKVCEVVWGKPDQQSLRKNVERFRNSPVMHPDVPKDFKPLLFTLGQESVFPAPTKRLRPPRGFSRKNIVDADANSASSDESDKGCT